MITAKEAKENLLDLIKTLVQSGYKMTDIKQLELKDVDLLIESTREREKEQTLDKAFPFLF